MALSAEVRLKSRLPLVARLFHARLQATLTATGEDLAAAVRANMYPGHAYETGYMHDHTAWEPTGDLAGQVHVDAPYAGFVEFGTSRMAPRPFLTPALAADWPKVCLAHAAQIFAGEVTETGNE